MEEKLTKSDYLTIRGCIESSILLILNDKKAVEKLNEIKKKVEREIHLEKQERYSKLFEPQLPL